MKPVVAQWSLILLCFSMAVAWVYVLGVKRVIWPLSIFASAERLSSDEKSSVTDGRAFLNRLSRA